MHFLAEVGNETFKSQNIPQFCRISALNCLQDLVKKDESDVLKPGNSKLTSLTELMDGKKKQESVGEEKKGKDEAVVPNSGAVDSWEELDNDDYSSKLVNEVHIIT